MQLSVQKAQRFDFKKVKAKNGGMKNIWYECYVRGSMGTNFYSYNKLYGPSEWKFEISNE